MLQEEHVRTSPRGQEVREVILQTLSNVSSPAYAQIATSIHLNLKQLLKSSKHYRLPSRAIHEMWAKFHCLRLYPDLLSSWDLMLKVASIKGNEAHLTLQLLIDRFLKQLVNQQVELATRTIHISVREQNAIRYMAGYVAIKLNKSDISYLKTSRAFDVLIHSGKPNSVG